MTNSGTPGLSASESNSLPLPLPPAGNSPPPPGEALLSRSSREEPQDSFAEFLARVRAGDAKAEQELWELYYPAIRREVQARLYHKGVRRVVGSSDICQIAFHSFYLRVRQGRFELKNVRDLLKLLCKMAQNKLYQEVARALAVTNNPGPFVSIDQVTSVAKGPTPSERFALRDQAAHFLGQLPELEQRLANLYFSGYTWEEIASQLGGKPDALRIRLMRALKRIRPRTDDSAGDRPHESD